MKTRNAVIISAVAMGLGLLAVAVGLHWTSATATRPPEAARLPAIPPQTNANRLVPRVSATNAAPVKFTWRSIETNDFKQYIANLRAIGCPERTIREIIIPEVSRRYTARYAAELEEYWRNFHFWDMTAARKESYLEGWRREELAAEKLAFLRELFGEDMGRELGSWWEINNARDDFDVRTFLPRDKAEQVRAINRKYEGLKEQMEAGWDKRPFLTTEEYHAELKQLHAQAHAELAQILTPQELEDYEMRTSKAADYVRRRLPEAKSKEEFRAMVKAAKASNMYWGRHWEELSDLSPDELLKKKQAEEQAFMEALKTALGETRHAELMEERRRAAQKQDRLYLVELVNREGVSEQAANEAHARMTALAEELEATVSRLPNLSREQQKELAAALREEQQKVIVELVGDKGYNIFQRIEHGRESIWK